MATTAAENSVIPTDLQLFCRNLRLLDLDRLDDWPRITVETFQAIKDAPNRQKTRIKNAEWVLYRLFELWDKKETQSKLQAFFPALEPLQSIKLRAALLQLFTTLKQNGVLAKECTLRKNMLDECRGEKFEQLLLSFSTAVLKRVMNQRKNAPATLLNSWLLSEPGAAPSDTTLKSAPVAMESDARRILAEKTIMKLQLSLLLQDLNVKQRQTETKEAQIMNALEAHLIHLIEDGVDPEALKTQIRNCMQGNRDWVNTFISGDHRERHDLFWDLGFNEIWASAAQGHVIASPGTVNDGMLADLEKRVEEQQTRLESWRDFQKELSRRSERFLTTKSPYKSPNKMETPRLSSRSPKKSATKDRSTPLPRRKLDFDQPTPTGGQSSPDAMAGIDNISSAFKNMSISKRSVDHDSPSTARPRSISPAKSRLFQEREKMLTPRSSRPAPAPIQRHNSDQVTSASKDVHSPESPAMPPPSRPTYHRRGQSAMTVSEASHPSPLAASPASQDSHSPEASFAITSPTLSLADRTRQSMALAGGLGHHRKSSLSQKQEVPVDRPMAQSTASAADAAPSSPEQTMTLTERAALSMSRLQASTHKRTQSHTATRPSSSRKNSMHQPTYTDRFAPGSSTQMANQAPEEPQVVEAPSTPQQQVGMDDLDAESVFMPRSRLRRSPPPA